MNESLIETALRSKIDWKTFESIVVDILRNDDMPSIIKLGGGSDSGIDAIEDKFFVSNESLCNIVQITSQSTQTFKLNNTIKKLSSNNINYDILTIIFRDPVSATAQAKMREIAKANAVKFLQVRDESYLIGELGNSKNGLFLKYFSDRNSYIKSILESSQNIPFTEDTLAPGILATACLYTYGYNRDFKFSALDRIVLAILIQYETNVISRKEAICIINEKTSGQITESSINASLKRLSSEGFCSFALNGDVQISAAKKSLLTSKLGRFERDTELAISSIVHEAQDRENFSDAECGRAERNVRKLLAQLVRIAGPMPTDRTRDALISNYDRNDVSCCASLSEGLTRNQMLAVASSFYQFISNDENKEFIALLFRSYAVLASCIVDPTGSKYSKSSFKGRRIYLDTETVINFIIKELPEHSITKTALDLLISSESELIITENVLREVVTHFEISNKTFNAVERTCSIKKLAPEYAKLIIKNALVRGYYFSSKFGEGRLEFLKYKENYHETNDPISFIISHIKLLNKNIVISEDISKLFDEDDVVLYDICKKSLEDNKEKYRHKAHLRNYEEMKEKAEVDATLSILASKKYSIAHKKNITGFVLSNDSAFSFIVTQSFWDRNKEIQLRASEFPYLIECLGGKITETEFCRLLFEPIAAYAASELKEEIDIISTQGTDLSRASLPKLISDIENGLLEPLKAYKQNSIIAKSPKDRIKLISKLHKELSRFGYEVDDDFKQYILGISKTDLSEDIATQFKELIKRLQTDSSTTKKHNRRIMRLIRDSGLYKFIEDQN